MTERSAMSDYRIEKVRRRVAVTLSSGTTLEGDIFLQAFARFRAGPEEPLDVLNEEVPFLALVMEDDEFYLVRKSQIAFITTDLPETDELGDASVVGMKADITFINGKTRSGSVFPDVRADRPRLIDYLNNTEMQFIPLFAADHLLIVNCGQVAFARPSA